MSDSFPFEKAMDITAALSILDKLKHGLNLLILGNSIGQYFF